MGKVCRVKTSTKKYKKRKGFLGTSKYVNTNVNNDVNNNVNIEDTHKFFNCSGPGTTNNQNPCHMEDSVVTSVSQKKVLPLKNAIESIISGYRIMDTVILNSIFGKMKCPVCSSFGLFVTEESAKKKGLASHLSVKCSECAYERSFYTSSRSDDKTFDINKRIIYSMRACGQGVC